MASRPSRKPTKTDDLKAITVPTPVLHGEDDQVVPIAASALKAVKLLPNGSLKTYPGFSHGMLTVNADVLNADLLEFITNRSDCGAYYRGDGSG